MIPPPRRRRARIPRSSGDFAALVVVIMLFSLAVAAVGFGCSRATQDQGVLTIQDKTVKRSCHSGSSCKDIYLIFTDKGTFRDTDSLAYFKYNSSDLYGKLQRGHRYKCKWTGVRVPLFSSYKNLIDCEEVS